MIRTKNGTKMRCVASNAYLVLEDKNGREGSQRVYGSFWLGPTGISNSTVEYTKLFHADVGPRILLVPTRDYITSAVVRDDEGGVWDYIPLGSEMFRYHNVTIDLQAQYDALA